MTSSQVTFEIRGTLLPGEVFAICGSCDSLGKWNPQNAGALLPENETGESMLWKATLYSVEQYLLSMVTSKGAF